MKATTSNLNIDQQEEQEISKQLVGGSNFDLQGSLFRTAKAKQYARQQLALSDDSPFSKSSNSLTTQPEDSEIELKRLRNEKADLLEQIKLRQQLEYLKSQLKSLKLNTGNTDTAQDTEAIESETDANQEAANNQQPQEILEAQKADKNDHNQSKPATNNHQQTEPKYRPLTGKTDCPNCNCDRRSSICNKCNVGNVGVDLAAQTSSMENRVVVEPTNRLFKSTYISDYDERPIRPMRDRFNATVETVRDIVVPGRVYTISKSLNDKRTKLAKAIDELQVTIDKVKARGERLDKERKLVQLYKDQWKYGPNIGNPISSSRDRLGLPAKQSKNYESRLDPNLARDTKSLLGFRGVESNMKLRQYPTSNKPDTQIKRKPFNRTTQNRISINNSRSKSLESLRTIAPSKISQPKRRDFDNGKSSSETNLATSKDVLQSNLVNSRSVADTDDGQSDEDEDEDEDVVVVDADADEGVIVHSKDAIHSTKRTTHLDESANKANQSANSQIDKTNNQKQAKDDGPKIQRMTWIPVFGETEVRTARQIPKHRKVTIVESSKVEDNKTNNNRIPARKGASVSTPKPAARITTSKPNPIMRQDKTLMEAKKHLKSASDLLESEKRDSVTKNQLVINRTCPRDNPMTSRTSQASSASGSSKRHTDRATITDDRELAATRGRTGSVNEISRLEEMINEQQRLLHRLVELQRDRPIISPVTVRCSSPSQSVQVLHSQANENGSNLAVKVSPNQGAQVGARSLVNNLRDKLNKTKLRLAKTLEEERQKHEQLKLEVDSSLRKQTDLEKENQLLKGSLNKCIDTCMRDILSTFESLSDSLAIQIGHDDRQMTSGDDDDRRQMVSQAHRAVDLSNAAQLISDNRHIKQMKSHIESVEKQRREIFDELGKEKSRTKQLEVQITENQRELSRLMEAKSKLELQLNQINSTKTNSQLQSISTNDMIHEPTNTGDKTNQPDQQQSTIVVEPVAGSSGNNSISTNNQQIIDNVSVENDTYNSLETYKRFINCISPDIEAMRHERKLLLEDLADLKKTLSNFEALECNV